MNSAIYEGSVRHRRHGDVPAELRFSLFMAYLDLDELPGVFDGSLLFSARRPAVARFDRADHLGDAPRPLADCVRARVFEQTGLRPDGPIRLLTSLRHLGHAFNPVSFYYCWDACGQLRAALAHVTNTPWGESHSYVLDCTGAIADRGSAAVVTGSFDKRLHVSPLMGMDHTSDWRLTVPAQRLAVHIDSRGPDGQLAFDATLSLARREISPASLRAALLRHPAQTTRALAHIYSSAMRLRLRGAPWHAHPGVQPPDASASLPAPPARRMATPDTAAPGAPPQDRVAA